MRGEIVKAWVSCERMRVDTFRSEGVTVAAAGAYKIPAKYEFVSDLPRRQIGRCCGRVLRQTEDKSEKLQTLAKWGRMTDHLRTANQLPLRIADYEDCGLIEDAD